MSAYRLGVDIGGTFTDLALYDDHAGRLHVHKLLTTPQDPSEAVLEGAAALLARANVPMASLAAVIHGTTLVTNAVIERRGAKTGMLVTAGFRDVLDMRRESRYDVFDLRIRFPAPLVPRSLRREIAERVRFDGSVAEPLDGDAVVAATRDLVEREGIESLAICFLHAYANPAHELAARDAVMAAFPRLYVSASAAVFPHIREFERWTTATMNAYAQPMFDGYLDRLSRGLRAQGFAGRLLIMTSSGGVLTPETARRFPVRMLESGPAAGVLMSALHGRAIGQPELLSFDMGGTTAKGALVRGYAPVRRLDMEVARVHEFKRGSGLPVKIPVIDMVEIGAGGGSIAALDERGLIRVGPQSAGADPGPACYGRGGTRPTLTDANLVLGYLDPAFFLGGAMRLDRPAAERAVASIADPLGLSAARAAWGIRETVSEDVARAFRVHASERGFDYRSAWMVAFGGSGPLHALDVARKLRVPRVVLPVGAGVMSALGLLASPLSFEISRSSRAFLADLDAGRFADTFASLLAEASAFLLDAGVDRAEIAARLLLDMRYQGQGHEIDLQLPQGAAPAAVFADLERLFQQRYRELFSGGALDEPVEIVNWRVEVTGPEPGLKQGYAVVRGGGDAAPVPRTGSRLAYDPKSAGYAEVPVFDRDALRPGDRVHGPALIDERESTCVLGEGDAVSVDEYDNLIADLGAGGRTAA